MISEVVSVLITYFIFSCYTFVFLLLTRPCDGLPMAEHCQKVMYIHCLTHTWWHLITAAWPTGFNHANILHGISLWMAEILDRFMTDDSMLTMFSILHMFVKSRFWNSSPNILVFPFLSLFIYHFISFLLVVLHSTSYLAFFAVHQLSTTPNLLI